MDNPIVVEFEDRATGKKIPAEIWKASSEYVSGEVQGAKWTEWHYGDSDEDSVWDWDAIVKRCLESPDKFECFSAWAGGEVVGMMVIDLQGQLATCTNCNLSLVTCSALLVLFLLAIMEFGLY